MVNYWLCPIYSFECNSEQIDLIEEIQIIKTPRKLIEYLDNKYPHMLPTILSETKWTIAIKNENIDTTNMSTHESMSIGFAQWNNAEEQLIDMITALRLYQKGRIVAGLMTSATLDNSEWSIGGSTAWTSVSNIFFFKEDPTYIIKQSELQKFTALFLQIRQYRALNVLNNIRVALERFHSSYHDDIKERIIDQMIALESLYLGNEQELKYRLALRSAFLLRKRKDHRDLVFKNIKKAYDLRSIIVHGNAPPSKDELREIVPIIENYLRQSIRIFLGLISKGMSLKTIREKLLDDNILTNGETLA